MGHYITHQLGKPSSYEEWDMNETRYEKINREAREAREAYRPDPIWNSPLVWLDCGGADYISRPVEDMLFAHYKQWARLEYVRTFKEVMREAIMPIVQDALGTHENHRLPLREVMRKQGKRLDWIDLGRDIRGKKHIVRVVVDIE